MESILFFRQCPMREPYKDKDLIIELPGNLTLHDVSWLSVYCYEVGVDFGHIEFKIPRGSQPLPPVLPLLREEDSVKNFKLDSDIFVLSPFSIL